MRNLDIIKDKYKEVVDKENNSGDYLDKYVQLKDGKHTVRVLPGLTELDMFFSETKLHRVPDSNKKIHNFHCLKMHGRACPLCELYFALWKEDQGGGGEANEKLAKQIKPRARYYFNVIDRKDDDKVKILSMGVKLWSRITKEIIQFAENVDEEGDAQEPIDLLSLDDGCDFIVVKKMVDKYPNYDDSKFRRKQTKAGVADALEQLHNLEELVRLEDYDKVRTSALSFAPGMSHLFEGVSSDATDDDEEEDVSSKDYSEQLEA